MMHKKVSQLCQLGSEANHHVKTDVQTNCEKQQFAKLCKTKVSTYLENKNFPNSQDFTKPGNKLNKDIHN